MYEFQCERCGARFETLVAAGTESVPCRECDAERTQRVLSAPGAPFHLVKTRREASKQEARNAELNVAARRRFKEALKPVHEAKRRRNPPGGSESA